MKKTIIIYFIVQLITALTIHASDEYKLTTNEEILIQHIQQSIVKAEGGDSSLPKNVLALEGMSSAKVRHLLNNLCSLPRTNYLEIGSWKGSTWIAALYNNSSSISSAIAIDNWSQFSGPKDQFIRNCRVFLKNMNYKFIESDCFQTDLTLFANPINLYFYDGDHSALSQEMAFTYFNEIFDNSFIAIVDDWNWSEVKEGTYNAFKQLGYTIVFETELPASYPGDNDNWWNGIYIALIRKAAL